MGGKRGCLLCRIGGWWVACLHCHNVNDDDAVVSVRHFTIEREGEGESANTIIAQILYNIQGIKLLIVLSVVSSSCLPQSIVMRSPLHVV